ncbi:MAG: hypothetical protein ACR2FQ_01070 [Pseudonocardiaceae bacterium]
MGKRLEDGRPENGRPKNGRRSATVVAGTAALLFAAGASFGAGSAAAAAPLVGVCGGEVQGAAGTPVAIAAGPVKLIHVGVIPEQGSAVLAVPALPLVGQPACAVTATVAEPVNAVAEPVNAVTAPVQEGTRALGGVVGGPGPLAPPPAQGAQLPPTALAGPLPAGPGDVLPTAAPFGPFLPLFAVGTPPASGIAFDYAGLFAASPATFGNLVSGNLFGYTPDFGILGAPGADAAAQDVAEAGRVQALPAQGADRVALPVLAAVLLLSMVTAALARSWAHGASRTT